MGKDDRDRDVYRPKTPAAGVRAQTSQPTEQRPPGPAEEWDDRTPVTSDPIVLLQFRQRRLSEQLAGVHMRAVETHTKVGEVAAQTHSNTINLVKLQAGLEAMNGKVDTLIEASAEEKQTRLDRAEAARLERKEREEREEQKQQREERRVREERKDRLAARKMTLSIVVPTIAAIAALVATIVAALRS